MKRRDFLKTGLVAGTAIALSSPFSGGPETAAVSTPVPVIPPLPSPGTLLEEDIFARNVYRGHDLRAAFFDNTYYRTSLTGGKTTVV